MPLRLLSAVRLSNLTDATTSPETQRHQNEGYASVYGHSIIGHATDLDVSGAVSVFERPELGDWLNNRVSEFDGIIVAKLDRLSRSIVDFGKLLEWADRNGKVIISVAESLDFSTPAGRMFANVLMAFAQFERERISERIKTSVEYRKANGYYHGGRIPFGMRLVAKDNHKIFALDESKQETVQLITDSLLGGMPAAAVERMLNETGVPAPLGKKWRAGEIIEIASNADIMDYETWTQVQAILKANSRKKHRKGEYILSGIVFCEICQQAMIANTQQGNGRDGNATIYNYMRCREHGRVKMAQIEEVINNAIDGYYGDEPYMIMKLVKAADTERLKAEVKRRIVRLDPEDDDYLTSAAALQAEMKAIKPGIDHWEEEDSGLTMRQVWETWTTREKNQWLRNSGWQVAVSKTTRPRLHIPELEDAVPVKVSGTLDG